MSESDVREIKGALVTLDNRVRDLQISVASMRGERRIQWGVLSAVGLAVLGMAAKLVIG